MDFTSMLDELEKLGAISDEDAQKALGRLHSLEEQKPSRRKMLEYGALGAVSGPVISGVSDLVRGKKPFEAAMGAAGKAVAHGRLRNVAGSALGGALGFGAIPLARYQLDKQRELGTLKQYVREYDEGQKTGSVKTALLERLVRLGATDIPGTPRLIMKHRSPEELASLQNSVTSGFKKVEDPIKRMAGKVISKVPVKPIRTVLEKGTNMLIENPETLPMQAVPIPGLTPGWLAAKKGAEKLIDRFAPLKVAAARKEKDALFTESQYSGGMGGGTFTMTSGLPPFRVPSLESTVQTKKAGAMTPTGISPASRLASSQRIAKPKITAPGGPSISQVAKPLGYGTPQPGAIKGGI